MAVKQLRHIDMNEVDKPKPKPKSKMGAPTKYNKALVIKLCKYLEEGQTISTACGLCGISNETFLVWRNEKPDFAVMVEAAEAGNQKQWVDQLISWRDKPNIVQWYLAHRYKKDWGDNQQTIEGGIIINLPQLPISGQATITNDNIVDAVSLDLLDYMPDQPDQPDQPNPADLPIEPNPPDQPDPAEEDS